MKKVGLALGGGGARGCAHIGVIKALQEAAIPIDFVAGTSIGALIGGIYTASRLKELEEYLLKIKWNDVLSQFDPTVMNNGMFKGAKVVKLLNKFIEHKTFKDCIIPFTAVATDIDAGKEVRLTEGNIANAIRASISLPAIFTVVEYKGKHLVDGGVINPLPINVARDMGADFVIAIDLNKKFIEEKRKKRRRFKSDKWDFSQLIQSKYPNMIDVVEGSVYLMQQTITEKNLETDPADFLLNLQLSSASMFDFHKAKLLIDEGYRQMKKEVPKLEKLLRAC